ncbi:MAG: TerC family protein [Caulobacterales bacterium]|nr:TerC family protein [Caulobacterales bacterium]
MAEFLASPELWVSLATLTFLEIILGIDNVVFVSVAADRLPADRAPRARAVGVYAGAVMRVALLFALVWLTGLSHATLFEAPAFLHGLASADHPERFIAFTLEDVVLLAGGLFLLWKGTTEIHHAIEGDHAASVGGATASFAAVMAQMMLINLVFGLDSVITAVGMTDSLFVMVAAVGLSTIVMVALAGVVSRFLERNPTTKMLALSFILLVGVALIADGLGFHIPRGYLYFAIAFSLMVEVFNVMARRGRRAEAAGH